MARKLEQSWPGLVALAVTVFLAVTMSPADKLSMAKDLSSPILNLFSIIVGFVATSLTFLAAAQDLPQLKRLRTTPHYKFLLDYHWAAIRIGSLATVLALIVISVCKTEHFSRPQNVIFFAWVLLSTWALGAFFRVITILKTILEPPKEKKEEINRNIG